MTNVENVPESLKGNLIIKNILERLTKLDEENTKLKNTEELLKVKFAGMKSVLEKEVGIKVIEYENEIKLEFLKEKKKAQTQSNPQKIMTVHDIVRLDPNNFIYCHVCECKLNKNAQKANLYFCEPACLSLFNSINHDIIKSLKKDINH